MRLLIKNLRMIDSFEISLDSPISVFIGEQASGKSTIAKAVYFAHYFPRFIVSFAINSLIGPSDDGLSLDAFSKNFSYYVGSRLPDVKSGEIQVFYSDEEYRVSIIFAKNGVKVDLNEKLKLFIESAFSETKGLIKKSAIDWAFTGVVRHRVLQLDEGIRMPIYLPAGRGPLIPLSDRYRGNRDPLSEDEFALSYIRTVVSNRRNFEYISTLLKTWADSKNPERRRVHDLVQTIIKGHYYQDKEGKERLALEKENISVGLEEASSGQQEIIHPILLLLGEVLEHDEKSIFIFEEPEAHLHPISQKAIVDLISYVANKSSARFVITTHSPYILTSFNPLILSGKYEKKGTRNAVVPSELRLLDGMVDAYSLETNPFCAKRIIDEDGTIDATDIDGVSERLNDQLFMLMKKGPRK